MGDQSNDGIDKVVVTFESVDEILNCDHSNEGH